MVTGMPNDALLLEPEWDLADRMRKALRGAGITAEDIAADLGVHRATVSRWLNGRGSPPRAIYLKEWAMRTGVPFEWLTGPGAEVAS
jgi:transcriptional regulator with XRE-family HTH domain